MRIPLLSLFMKSPFEGLQEHAEKIKECAWTFKKAMECYTSSTCITFEDFRKEIISLESQADAIKRRIRGHIPVGTLMPVDKFQLFMYLREQDQVIDTVEDALDWISYRPESGIPEELTEDFSLLVDVVMDPIEELIKMVSEARKYFKNYSNSQRLVVKDLIRTIRLQEQKGDKLEDAIKRKIFSLGTDPVTMLHMIKLSELIGSIADHAENAGDMMRAMISR